MAAQLGDKIYFITGASSGIGLALGLSALRAGHRVIGTSRNAEKAATQNPEFERLGGRWLELQIADPSAQQTIESLVKEEEAKLPQGASPHWVVVNNAGAGLVGSVEETSEALTAEYFEGNVFGVMRVWRAMVPTLRRHRKGTLITVSSYMGVINKAEQMMYCAVKATTASLTGSYADLLGPLGIRTMIIEPGGFRTKFMGNIAQADLPRPEEYKEKMEQWNGILDMVAKNPKLVKGDAELFGPTILDAVDGKGLFKEIWENQDLSKALHIPVGSDSYEVIDQKLKELSTDLSKMKDIAQLTDAKDS